MPFIIYTYTGVTILMNHIRLCSLSYFILMKRIYHYYYYYYYYYRDIGADKRSLCAPGAWLLYDTPLVDWPSSSSPTWHASMKTGSECCTWWRWRWRKSWRASEWRWGTWWVAARRASSVVWSRPTSRRTRSATVRYWCWVTSSDDCWPVCKTRG